MNISAGNGEGLLNSGNELIFRDTKIAGNRASEGGGLYIGDSNFVVVDACVFSGNTALLQGGGGICVYQRSGLKIINTSFEFNRAVSCGGGVESVLSNALLMNGKYTLCVRYDV